MSAPTNPVEAEMIPGGWTELVVRDPMADLRREAEPQRLIRLAHRGSGTRRAGMVRWHGWGGLIRPARIRSQHRPPWRGLAFLTQQGDQS